MKPHALAEHHAGAIISSITQSGLDLRQLELFSVDRAAAGEFYEVYRGVVAPSEFSNMVDELTSGPCLAAEISSRYAAHSSSSQLGPSQAICLNSYGGTLSGNMTTATKSVLTKALEHEV